MTCNTFCVCATLTCEMYVLCTMGGQPVRIRSPKIRKKNEATFSLIHGCHHMHTHTYMCVYMYKCTY